MFHCFNYLPQRYKHAFMDKVTEIGKKREAEGEAKQSTKKQAKEIEEKDDSDEDSGPCSIVFVGPDNSLSHVLSLPMSLAQCYVFPTATLPPETRDALEILHAQEDDEDHVFFDHVMVFLKKHAKRIAAGRTILHSFGTPPTLVSAIYQIHDVSSDEDGS